MPTVQAFHPLAQPRPGATVAHYLPPAPQPCRPHRHSPSRALQGPPPSHTVPPTDLPLGMALRCASPPAPGARPSPAPTPFLCSDLLSLTLVSCGLLAVHSWVKPRALGTL